MNIEPRLVEIDGYYSINGGEPIKMKKGDKFIDFIDCQPTIAEQIELKELVEPTANNVVIGEPSKPDMGVVTTSLTLTEEQAKEMWDTFNNAFQALDWCICNPMKEIEHGICSEVPYLLVRFNPSRECFEQKLVNGVDGDWLKNWKTMGSENCNTYEVLRDWENIRVKKEENI